MKPRTQDRAKWYRIDLHTHTPASADYQQPDITYLDILHRAEQRGIDILAFTDHNTVSGYATLRRDIEQLEFLVSRGRATPDEQRLLAEYQRVLDKVLVLPGFEFTATFGFHILGIFPPETPVRKLEHLLLGLRVPYEAIERGLTEVGASADVLTAYRMIRNEGGLVIAAHVNAAHGVAMFKIDFGGQTRIAYTQDPYLSALEVTDLAKRGRYATAHFFDGSKPEYPRRMHCIQGSDAHRLDTQVDRTGKVINFGVGERPTEVRLSERSFDALRALFESNDFNNSRPFTPAAPVDDPFTRVRAQGSTSVQAFHENPTQAGVLRINLLNDICAFANGQGGTLYLGVSDDAHRPPAGVDNADLLIEQITRAAESMITPQVQLVFEAIETQDKTILRVQVPRGMGRPYALDGSRIYLRSGAETRLATRDEIIQMVMEGRNAFQEDVPAQPPAPVAVPFAPPQIEERPRRRDDDERRERFDRPRRSEGRDMSDDRRRDDRRREPRAEAAPREDRAPSRLDDRERRERRRERTPDAAPAVETAPAASGELVYTPDMQPRVGVEIVSVEPRGGLNVYTVRDLQTNSIQRNVTRVVKSKTLQSAIKRYEMHPMDLDRVTWNGAFGLWRKYRRLTEVRYDLVLRTHDGVRYFYGVPESELKGGWQVFANLEAQVDEGAAAAAEQAVALPEPTAMDAADSLAVAGDVGVEPAVDVGASAEADEDHIDAADGAEVALEDVPKKKRRRRGGRNRRRTGSAATATGAEQTDIAPEAVESAEVLEISEQPEAPILADSSPASEPLVADVSAPEVEPPRKTRSRRKPKAEAAVETPAPVEDAPEAPKRRGRRKKAEAGTPAPVAEAPAPPADDAPKVRTRRKKAEAPPVPEPEPPVRTRRRRGPR